ncbi:MAG: hypothetical protein CVV42_14195 [Candidatus Riflebacteria bacterium HGW-Riflebacteria-2]|jgi:hypothetical protein|nr:MAG: hypothetical protein CVV42_14195 [Candidatus Riflebacteria bacterium HGW-Riflebacteria-2]
MDLKSEDLNHFPPAAAPAAEFNNRDAAEIDRCSRGLLRKTREQLVINGHDKRYAGNNKQMKRIFTTFSV